MVRGTVATNQRGRTGVPRDGRGVSAVVAIALLLGVTVMVALIAAPFVFGVVGDFGSDAPDADFAFLYEEGAELGLSQPTDDFGTPIEQGDGLVTIQLERGDTIDPANVHINGSASGGNLLADTDDTVFAPGDRLRDGDTIRLAVDRGETVRLVWTADDGDESAIIGAFTINVPDSLTPPWVPDPDVGCEYIEDQLSGSDNDVEVLGVVVECDLDQYYPRITDLTIASETGDFGAVVGEVNVTGDIDITDGGTFQGNVESGTDGDDGDIDISDSSRVSSDIVAKGDGDVDIDQGSSVDGDIAANGAVSLQQSVDVSGDVISETGSDSDTDIAVSNSAVSGDIRAKGGDGDVEVSDGTVSGDIEANGTVDADASSLGGDLTSSGDLDIDNVTVDGSLTTTGDGDIDVSASVVEGGVDPAGSFTCANSKIDGQSCDEYVSPALTVEILNTNSPVQQGEMLEVDATFENTGFAGEAETVLEIDGEQKDTLVFDIGRNETTTKSFLWDTSGEDHGARTATVASEADEASEMVTVSEAGTPTFDLTVDSYDAEVSAGEDLNVTVTIENVGGTQGTETVKLNDFDGTVVDSESVTLADGDAEQLTLTWETDASDVGEDQITVETGDDTEARTVEVLEVSYEIEDVLLVKDGNEISVEPTVDTNDPDAELKIESIDTGGGGSGPANCDPVCETRWVPAETNNYNIAGANQADTVEVTLFDGDGNERDVVEESWNG